MGDRQAVVWQPRKNKRLIHWLSSFPKGVEWCWLTVFPSLFFFYQKIRAPFGASTDTTLGAGTGSCPVADWPSESPGLDYQDKDSARLSSHQPSPAALLPRKGSLVPPHPFQLGESSIPLAKPHGLWQSSRLAVITDCSRIDSELGCPKGAGVDEAAACLWLALPGLWKHGRPPSGKADFFNYCCELLLFISQSGAAVPHPAAQGGFPKVATGYEH